MPTKLYGPLPSKKIEFKILFDPSVEDVGRASSLKDTFLSMNRANF